MQGSLRKKGGSWYYSFELAKIDGKRQRIERKGGKTKSEAQAALRNAILEYEQAGRVESINNISFSDYIDYWLKQYVEVNCKYTTYMLYERYARTHLKPILGSYKLKNINPSLLQDFLNKKRLSGFSKTTVSSFYGMLSGCLKYAVHPLKYINENPMQYVSMPKYDTLRKKDGDDLRLISIGDFKNIIERFPKGSSFYVPLQIAFNTGLRAGEVCGLTWNDIDFKNKTLEVNKILTKKDSQWLFGTPKTQSSHRVISIGDTLLKILKEHSKFQKEMQLKYGKFYKFNILSNEFICTKENGDLVTIESLKYLSRVVNYELKINFNFHSLRHTHATMLIENGANIKAVQKRLGHSKLSTTMDTYAHVTQKMNTDTVDILESVLKGS